jgi:hypothetical protein
MKRPRKDDTTEGIKPAIEEVKAEGVEGQEKKYDDFFECQECAYILRLTHGLPLPICPLCHSEGLFQFVCDEVDYNAGFGILPKNKYAEPVLLMMIQGNPGLTAAELKARLEDMERERAELEESEDEDLFVSMCEDQDYYFEWPPLKLQRALDHLQLEDDIVQKDGKYYWYYYKPKS